MKEAFGPIYADAYDLLYDDKNYAAECELINHIFRTYSGVPVRSVLDLGCGTGNHAFLLAERGYEVVGVDRSESMLVQAQKKVAFLSNMKGTHFQRADIRSVDLQRHFDAVLMMFAVLSYQLGNSDVLSALRSSRRHLNLGGLFIFDFWYGPAVLRQQPSQRFKVVPTPEGQILRVASGELDTDRHVCTVNINLWRWEEGRLAVKTEERHSVRYFFPLELARFLEFSNFSLIRLGAFPQFDRSPDQTTWNVLGLAQAS